MVKLPINLIPASNDLELRTISALIQLGDPFNLRVQDAMLKLDRYCFFNIQHKILFELIEELFSKKKSFQFVEIINLVADEQASLICESLRDIYCSIVNLESDVDKLLSYRLYRNQLTILIETVNLSLEQTLVEDSLEVIRENIQSLSKTSLAHVSSIVRSYETIADEFLSEIEEDNSQFIIDIPHLPPVPNRALITIAGRSGHGKTFFALYLMDKIIDAQSNKQTLYFNLEMHERMMLERHAKLLGANGDGRKQIIKNALPLLLPKNVSLISEPMIAIEQIETHSRLAFLAQPIAVIVVDYLGLVGSKAKYDRKDLQQNDIAKRLAALSIELDCVVIALIQVNRDFKNRIIGDRCPLPTDAAESMGSVHSSSWWVGIDRPEQDDSSEEFKNLFQVACRKNRGDGGMFNLQFKFKNGKFEKWCKPFSVNKTYVPDGF